MNIKHRKISNLRNLRSGLYYDRNFYYMCNTVYNVMPNVAYKLTMQTKVTNSHSNKAPELVEPGTQSTMFHNLGCNILLYIQMLFQLHQLHSTKWQGDCKDIL